MTDPAARSKTSPLAYRACALWKDEKRRVEALPLVAEVVRRAQQSGNLDGVAMVVLECGFARLPKDKWGMSDDQIGVVEADTLASLCAPGALDSFGGRSSFRTWVHTIAVNRAKNLFRTNDRRRNGEEKFSIERVPGSRMSSFAVTRAELDKARGWLPKQDYDYLKLWLEHGNYQAVADEFGDSYSTARHRILRAQVKLETVIQRPNVTEGKESR